jgi:O-antigen/teichoic acid export membrane protein
MWGFGMNVSIAQVISGASEQVLNLLIGAIFGAIALGYFSIAWRMVQLVKALISSAVYYVGLSAFAKLQDDRAAVLAAFLQSTRIACLLGFPIAVGMSFVGRPLIEGLFGNKWDSSIPLLMVLAFEMIPAFYCIFLSSLYRAMNRPFWVLAMASVYLLFSVLAVLAAAPWGVTAIAAFWVAREVLLVPVHMALVQRLLGASLSDLLRPMLTPIIASAIMGVCVVLARLALDPRDISYVIELLMLVPAGAVIYAAAVWLLSPDLFRMALRTASVVAGPMRKKPAVLSNEVET